MKGQEENGEGKNISLPSNIGRIWKEEKIKMCEIYKLKVWNVLSYVQNPKQHSSYSSQSRIAVHGARPQKRDSV